jgi:acylphosphatase
MSGDPDRMTEVFDFLRAGKELNDWGAKVENLVELQSGSPVEKHQVTTSNVDTFDWNPNVKMYL